MRGFFFRPKKMKHEKSLIILKIILTLILIIAATSIYLYFSKFDGPLSDKQETWGQFGDFIGGTLNPLIAIAALIALIQTIRLQATELNNSTIQLEKSANALAAQNEATKKQSFESSFFNMTLIFNELVRDLSHDGSNGKECIRKIHQSLSGLYLHNIKLGNNIEPTEKAINMHYKEFYEEYGHLIEHYFRTLYNIIKFIDSSHLDWESKKFYAELIRAQLSRYEINLILYNCISSHGKKFLPLVKKYNLLKHLEPASLPEEAHAKLI